MSKNENIIAKLNELDRAVIEVKCAESDCRYMQIQECSSELGYDYTFYTEDGEDIDGGIYSCVSDSDQMPLLPHRLYTSHMPYISHMPQSS